MNTIQFPIFNYPFQYANCAPFPMNYYTVFPKVIPTVIVNQESSIKSNPSITDDSLEMKVDKILAGARTFKRKTIRKITKIVNKDKVRKFKITKEAKLVKA